jgi:FAD binding domain
VTATLRDLSTGAESSVRAKYVVAADGNRSPVRERLGIGMRGHGLLSHSITIYFRALADLGPLLADRNQGVHYVTNPLMRGFFRLDRSGNAGFLVVNLVGDTSRPEVIAAFPSAPWANVAEGITEQRALELLRAAIGVPGIGVVIENIATWRAARRCTSIPGSRRAGRGRARRTSSSTAAARGCPRWTCSAGISCCWPGRRAGPGGMRRPPWPRDSGWPWTSMWWGMTA